MENYLNCQIKKMAGKGNYSDRNPNSENIYLDEDSNDTDDTYSDSDSDLDLYEGYEDSDCDLSDEDEIEGNEDPLHIDENNRISTNNVTDTGSSMIWSKDVKPIRNFPFDEEKCGIQINITGTSTPREVFDQLFTTDIINMLVNSTNVYGNDLYSKPAPATRKSPKVNFRDTNNTEMYKFLGLCLLMGQSKYPTIRLAFSKHPLYYRPIFPATMSGRRFQILLRTFSCHMPITKADKEADKLARIKPLLQLLLKSFNDAYVPFKQLSLDESLLLWRGRLSFRQYIKNKAAKYGIKFYELTTSDGYVLNVIIYQGKDSDEPGDNTSKTAKIVLDLMKPYLDKGHHLYMDNFYNSVSLSTHLLSKQTHTTGTLRSNRKENPKIVVQSKLKKGEINWRRFDDVYITKWRDKRDVLTITTAHHPALVEVKNRRGESTMKPQDVADYNQYMSGVDRLDQMISYYNTTRKTIRWYKKVLLHLVDVTVWNSYYLYKQTHPKVSFLTFRDSLIQSLIQLPENVQEGRQLVALVPSLGNLKQIVFESTLINYIYSGRPRASKTQAPLEDVSSEASSLLTLSVEVAIHQVEKIPVPAYHKRKNYFQRCQSCAKEKVRKDTSYRCADCPGRPPMCRLCFENHQPDQVQSD